jgi:hypothetical protein
MRPTSLRMTGGARHVLHTLLKQPGYMLATIATLSLAVAANSAIFGAVHAVLLTPLPIEAPSRLVVCWAVDRPRNLPVVELSYRTYQAWEAAAPSFAAMAALGSSNWTAVLEGNGDPARVQYAGVTASFFDTMGVRPLIGRGFDAREDVPNAGPVVVLNYGTWIRRFGGDHKVGRHECDSRRTLPHCGRRHAKGLRFSSWRGALAAGRPGSGRVLCTVEGRRPLRRGGVVRGGAAA